MEAKRILGNEDRVRPKERRGSMMHGTTRALEATLLIVSTGSVGFSSTIVAQREPGSASN